MMIARGATLITGTGMSPRPNKIKWPELAVAVRAKPALAQLSAAAKDAHKPLSPEELVDAQQDRVHRDRGSSRAARTVRSKSEFPTPHKNPCNRGNKMITLQLTAEEADYLRGHLYGIGDNETRRAIYERLIALIDNPQTTEKLPHDTELRKLCETMKSTIKRLNQDREQLLDDLERVQSVLRSVNRGAAGIVGAIAATLDR